MSKKFFTSDWHLNQELLSHSSRHFKSVDKMNNTIINNANARAKDRGDLIIHVGDFYCYGSDQGSMSIKMNPKLFLDKINAQFINIRGNHDDTNKVLSLASILSTKVGPYNVLVSHFPSYEDSSKVKSRSNIIHICGHVHKSWKYFYDEDRNILNINVGVDVWRYNIISEAELVVYLESLARSNIKIQKLLKMRKSRR
jgi:calcineurin-like phosphoesterase family protein